MEELKVEPAEAVEEAEPLFGPLDIILLVLLAIASIYYFWFKDKNKKDESAISSFSVSSTNFLNKGSEGGFISKMKSSGRNVIVFYGSQTGTAEEFAGRLAKEATRWGMKGMVSDLEDCDMTELSQLAEIENHLAIFCMATYGEGDPTDNAQEFYEQLQSGDLDVTDVQFTVFGLGNKTYEHYNATGKFVDKKLEELGGKRLFDLGLGDDDANMEDDFITWKDEMWAKVCEIYGLEASGMDINMRQYELKVHTDYNPDRLFTGEIGRLHSTKPQNQRAPFDAKNPFMAEVTKMKELHRGGDRNCLHIELNIEGSRIRYDAGDHVAIFPINEASSVDKLCKLVGEDPEKVISLINLDEDSSKKVPFPCPCTYRTALSHYVDIHSLPRTHVLKEIAEYASDPKEKEKLQLMGSNSEAGKAEYQKWIVQSLRNIIHILEDLPSCKPPLDHLCELLPRLQARYYSISSTPKVHPNSIHVTAVVLKYETPTGRFNKGVCTNWLLRHMLEDNGTKFKVPIFVRKSQFRLPNKPSVPVLMIGPGTGIAPFRGFIQERNFYKENGKEVGRTVLYFGCRYKKNDYIYEDELKQFSDSGILELHVAFSREQPHKVYVSHLLEENKKEVWNIIGQENGHLYVCGDAKNMARDVHAVITKLCETEGGMTPGEAETYVKKMINQRRYSSDVWS